MKQSIKLYVNVLKFARSVIRLKLNRNNTLINMIKDKKIRTIYLLTQLFFIIGVLVGGIMGSLVTASSSVIISLLLLSSSLLFYMAIIYAIDC